jgi:hypothetical protein
MRSRFSRSGGHGARMDVGPPSRRAQPTKGGCPPIRQQPSTVPQRSPGRRQSRVLGWGLSRGLFELLNRMLSGSMNGSVCRLLFRLLRRSLRRNPEGKKEKEIGISLRSLARAKRRDPFRLPSTQRLSVLHGAGGRCIGPQLLIAADLSPWLRPTRIFWCVPNWARIGRSLRSKTRLRAGSVNPLSRFQNL